MKMINHPNRSKAAKALKASAKPLPRFCFAINPEDGKVVMIRYGENGYYPQPDMTPFDRLEQNGLLGITEEDERVMMLGSLFGWDCPGVVRHFHGGR